jgi:hypothetical protein
MLSRVIAALVLLGLGYVLVNLGQPYMHSYQFDQLLKQDVDSPSLHPQTSVLHKQVLRQARDMGFIVSDEDVQVERLVRGFQVRVHYLVPVDLRFYHAAIEFNSVVRTTTELE